MDHPWIDDFSFFLHEKLHSREKPTAAFDPSCLRCRIFSFFRTFPCLHAIFHAAGLSDNAESLNTLPCKEEKLRHRDQIPYQGSCLMSLLSFSRFKPERAVLSGQDFRNRSGFKPLPVSDPLPPSAVPQKHSEHPTKSRCPLRLISRSRHLSLVMYLRFIPHGTHQSIYRYL